MIIKSTRIKTKSGTKSIKNHLLNKPEDNEKIRILKGNESDFETFHDFADEDKTMYSLRHFSINPGQSWTTEQMAETVDKIRVEYGAKDRPFFAVRHDKKLADGTNNTHIHMIIPERWIGKTLDNKFAYQRNEKISRMCEYDFKHEITTGKHNKAVGHALAGNEKYKELSDIILNEHVTKPRPKASYSSNDLQIAKRQGVDLPKSKLEIKDIHSRSDNYQSFEAGLKESGYQIKQGEKAFIIEKDGTFIGSANRLLKMKKSDFEQFMKGNNYENNSKGHQRRHNRNTKSSPTPRRTKQGGRTHRTNSSNESQDRPAKSRDKQSKGIDEKYIQKSISKMTFQDNLTLKNINNSDKIPLVKTEIKNNNNLLKNISKFFKSVFKKENDNISQKDLDDLNEIDLMSDDQKIMNSYISKELENEIFNPKKPEIETQKTEPQKTPEPPKPTGPDFSKWERPKIGRQSEKKKKKPDASVSASTPTNLNNTLMEDVARDKDLPAAPRF